MHIRLVRDNGGVGVFAMKPLGGGHLIGDNRGGAMEYLPCDRRMLDAVAVGMQSFAEIDANVAPSPKLAATPELLHPLARGASAA